MKKLLLAAFIGLLVLLVAACGSSGQKKSKDPNVLEVYTTVYPLTYFTERIGGKHVTVQSVYPAGTNEHSFDPTQKDMMSLADADLFLYIGLGLEGFVDSAKKTLKDEHVSMVATADAISEKELAEDEEHEQKHEGHDGHDHGDIDPHVWISPKLSASLAESVKDALSEKDPENAKSYQANYEKLAGELEQLDQEFQTMADSSANKTFFVSHAAFGYLADSYGLEQIAVAGLNSQDEPSQKELAEIVDLAKEKKIKTILFEQNVSSNLAEVIKNEIGAESLKLHNLGVLTQDDIKNKETYFTLMEQNLKTLEKALKSAE